MELKDLGLQRINLDLSRNITENFFAKEGDIGTRGLSIKVLNNSVEIDTTGVSITMYARVGQEVYSVDATVKDALKGEYELIYPTSILKSGIIYAELQLKKLNDIISTKKFKILVESGIVTDSAIEGHDSYPIFEQLLEAGANEEVRVSNEQTRITDEEERISNESERISNESERISNESMRQSNENTRIADEDERDNRELERASNESTRIADEISRIENESVRDSSEIARENNELIRESNDITRQQNESTRQQNENTRITNEEIRELNETARDDAESLRGVRLDDLENDLTTHKEDYASLFTANADAKNSIYRGKHLGGVVTAEQYTAISSGTFTDLYIGDYWTIEGVNWRIAAFNYYRNTGNALVPGNHITIVPDTQLYPHAMNDTNITTGGYTGSKMYTAGLEQAKSTIRGIFGTHLVKHRQIHSNAIVGGKASGWAWVDSEVDLMSEIMVYGSTIWGESTIGGTGHNIGVGKSQLPLFALNPRMINTRQNYWLRDVVSASLFAGVDGLGYASYYSASYATGVRPAFSIS